ncbi:subtilisin-like protease SBT3.17 [Iris pallida]|uniref:Subtilisin-like protease SBT3.17 n=1 Tax=Iris pallida TaxID=29817 RepID=A0AAX6EH28_IRIPA|nr:subtilisin-like protease SBT3.17 [Iris pallida]KAJ6836492.1 subtilisin-like protease SBT3.17 [Iris pallida]
MEKFPSALLSVVAFFLLLVSISIPSSSAALMAEQSSTPAAEEPKSVHIVYVDRPVSEEPEAFHIRTLASVVGSEDAAKDAVIYHYTHAASGFSAKLTAKQVEELAKQPGVLQVTPDGIAHLHKPVRVGHMGLA